MKTIVVIDWGKKTKKGVKHNSKSYIIKIGFHYMLYEYWKNLIYLVCSTVPHNRHR